MREILGILLGFFLAAALGYLISGIRQKEQEKDRHHEFVRLSSREWM